MPDQFIDVEGTEIRYRDTGGDGMPVLLGHGIGQSLEFWDHQLDAGLDQLRLIAWDLPGHGLSAMGDQPHDPTSFAAFAVRFLDALGLEQAHIAGNSLGATIAIRMAGLVPDRLRGIVLAGTASLGREVFLPFRLMNLPGLGELMTRPGKAAIDQQLKAVFHDRAVATDDVREVVARNGAKAGGQKAFLATLRRMTSLRGQRAEVVEPTRAILASLPMPALFIHGRQDVVVPAEHSIDADRITPDSTLLLLDECGHAPQLEKPEAFNTALVDFVTSTSG